MITNSGYRKRGASSPSAREGGLLAIMTFLYLRTLFFPSLCYECKTKTDLHYFCKSCWQQSPLADPGERCVYCFGLMEIPGKVCIRCADEPFLPFPRAALFDYRSPICRVLKWEEAAEAAAGFAYLQWNELSWPKPDFIVSISKSPIAKSLAKLFEVPYPSLFRRSINPFQKIKRLLESIIEEEGIYLLLDEGNSLAQLKNYCVQMEKASAKKVYVLSLGA